MAGMRREWDSNPRYRYQYNGFRDRPIRPLWHLSVFINYVSHKNKKIYLKKSIMKLIG